MSIKALKLEITYAELEAAMCAKDQPCTAHQEAAAKLWQKLEKSHG